MIKRLLYLSISIIIGIYAGIISAYYCLYRLHDLKNYSSDYWGTDSPILTDQPNPYVLARQTHAKKMELETNEDIILRRYKDDQGNDLSANCIYEISNLDLPCSFFTIYCENQFGESAALPAKTLDGKECVDNHLYPYELNSENLLQFYNKKNSIIIAPPSLAQGGNWLASPSLGNYNIVLTLYNVASIKLHQTPFVFPKIRKISCR